MSIAVNKVVLFNTDNSVALPHFPQRRQRSRFPRSGQAPERARPRGIGGYREGVISTGISWLRKNNFKSDSNGKAIFMTNLSTQSLLLLATLQLRDKKVT